MVLRILALTTLVFGILWLGFTAAIRAQGPIDTTFTFQGRLIQNDVYITDTCDFQFNLYDSPSGGAFVAGPINKTGVSVAEGYFTADLDFGSVFTGNKRYLQVSVQCSADGSPTILNGRMELTGAPYALYAQNAANAGSTDWADVTSIPSPDFADNIDNTGELNNFVCSNGQILVTDTTTTGNWGCDTDAGSVPGTLDHGTTLITSSLADDDHPHYLLVSGTRAMGGNLSMGSSSTIANVGDGINPTDAVNRSQAIEQTETGGDISGTYNNAIVSGIRGRTITSTAPISGQGLVWSGSTWQVDLVGPSGPAGGDFTGNFPNPSIASDVVDSAKIADNAVGASEIAASAVGSDEIADDAVRASEIIADAVRTSEIAANAVRMSELNTKTGSWSMENRDFTEDAGTYIFGSGTFTPDANGTCLVVASGSVASGGTSSQDGGYLRTARRIGTSNSQDNQFGFYFDNAANKPSVTVNHVWSVTAGQATQFGCYIVSVEDIFGNNETLDCRVSYFCE